MIFSMSQVETLQCALSAEHKVMNNKEFEIWFNQGSMSAEHSLSTISYQCCSLWRLTNNVPVFPHRKGLNVLHEKSTYCSVPRARMGNCSWWQSSGTELLSLALHFPYILQIRNMAQSVTYSTLQLNFQKESIWVVKYRGREGQHSRKSFFLFMVLKQ